MKYSYWIFLGTVTIESMKQLQEHQTLLRLLLEAAAKSGQELDQYIAQNTESVSNLLLCSSICAYVEIISYLSVYTPHQLLSPNFLVYLDAEVQGAERDSPAEHMLVIIQLKLLAEQGRRYTNKLQMALSIHNSVLSVFYVNTH